MSGWCTQCGRRRGSDGRCVNCDPWWTSPLIQVGGPALAICCVFLVGLVAAVSSPRSDPAADSSGDRQAPPAIFSTGAVATRLTPPVGPLSAPYVAAAPPPLATMPTLPADYFAPPPPPDAQQMAEFEELRYRVRVASGQMRSLTDSQARYGTYTPASPSTEKRGPGSVSASQPL
jgi:hypothetical protein